MTTPKILYQTWKTKNIPPQFAKNQRKWLDAIDYVSSDDSKISASEWKYVLLDDNDLRNLVKSNFPQYLNAYDSFTKNIERVDFARLVMMYIGGVYADLDTYPVKPIDKWISEGKIVLGREPIEHAKKLYGGRVTVLCNAFMISPPHKQIWVDMMNYIIKNYEPNFKPVYNTGPMAMTLFMESHRKKFDDVIITDPCVFFPMLGDSTFSSRCIDSSGKLLPDTYVVHEWENTWVVKWWEDPELFNARYWFWGSLTIFVVLWLRAYNAK